MKTIGVIGNGFVGGAVAHGFKNYNVKVFDKDKSKANCTLDECIQQDIVFIAVPTPMSNKNNGRCNLSIINSVFDEVSGLKPDCSFVIKSTVPIGTTSKLQSRYPHLKIFHSPEFLTEKNANDDFDNPSRNIIGTPVGSNNNAKDVEDLFTSRFPLCPCYLMSSDESETVKYIANCFLAIKVSFFNEIKILCDSLDLNFNKILSGVTSDERVGDSHCQVPGHDGRLGFGGTCFPKDINSLINIMKDQNLEPKLLSAAWDINLKVRPEKDWENFSSAVLD